MSGNVWQWVSDWRAYTLDPDLRTYPQLSVNPRGPESGEYKMSKGGGFFNTPPFCTVYARGWDHPSNGGGRVGFRVAMDPPSREERDFRPNFELRIRVKGAIPRRRDPLWKEIKSVKSFGVVQDIDAGDSTIRYWRIRRGGEYYLILEDASGRATISTRIELDGRPAFLESFRRGDVIELDSTSTVLLSVRATRK
jgi:hypothetical protein